MDHPPDRRLPWFGVILNRPRPQAHHIVEARSVLDILCRDLIACIHVTGLTCADFWSRCQDVRMLTTGYRANFTAIGIAEDVDMFFINLTLRDFAGRSDP